MIIRVFLCVSLLLVFGLAKPQEPTPAPAKPAEKPQDDAKGDKKKPGNDKRGTVALPTVVELSPSSIIKVETVDKTERHDDYSSSEWWLVYLTATLAFLTGGLALYTARLWAATGKLVRGSEETAVRQLRAYMLPEKARLINVGDPKPTYSFQAKNYGQTPAHEVTIWVAWRYFDINKIEIPTERPQFPAMSSYLIGPQGFASISDHVFLDIERKNKIRDEEAILFLFGDIRYKDIFGKTRSTKFRFAWGGNYDIGPDGALTVHAEGNETDCSDT